MPSTYLALLICLQLSQLQGDLWIFAACRGKVRCQAASGHPGQGLCDHTCGEVAWPLPGMTRSLQGRDNLTQGLDHILNRGCTTRPFVPWELEWEHNTGWSPTLLRCGMWLGLFS